VKIAVATIEVPGRGPVPVFQPHELAAIEAAMIRFNNGQEPDQATADACVAALAEARLMGIGLRYVLEGKSAVGFSEEDGLLFAGGMTGTMRVQPEGNA
jgi:hypothetical protein